MLYLKNFQDCSKYELLMILDWRNNPAIRKNMVNDSVISEEDHLSFVNSLKGKNDKKYYLVFENMEPIGVVNLINIKDFKAELGLYKNPEINRKGVGVLLMKTILEQAIFLNILYLILKVKKCNTAAIKIYDKFNFKITNEDVNYFFMEKYL